MKLSIYTFVQNGLYMDFHVVEMLKHHLPLADEIVVNEGYSNDGTYEAIARLDPKIRVTRTHWDRSDPATWHVKFKNCARQWCTGDWCILLDCDEFIPEWEFARLRDYLAATEANIARVRFLHFYGNYKVVRKGPPFASRIHRNLPGIVVYGDGSDVRDEADNSEPSPEVLFECHHFGEVRHPARLRQKWRTQAQQHSQKPRWSLMPGIVFDILPHDWMDADLLKDLSIYEGPYLRAVRESPSEFVRDNFLLHEHIAARQANQRGASDMPATEP